MLAVCHPPLALAVIVRIFAICEAAFFISLRLTSNGISLMIMPDEFGAWFSGGFGVNILASMFSLLMISSAVSRLITELYSILYVFFCLYDGDFSPM